MLALHFATNLKHETIAGMWDSTKALWNGPIGAKPGEPAYKNPITGILGC
jgi:hypothetical protein